MTLKVIGSGFGRTGTRSLKEALEILGFGLCHHMEEVLGRPDQVPLWVEALTRPTTDMERLYAGYASQVDWPGAHVWRQAAAAFPDAKVIHSQRPDDSWWRSFSTTIGKLMRIYETLPLPPHIRAMFDVTVPAIADRTFGARRPDRETALAAYLHAWVSNQLQAAIRLSVTGQQGAARILAALEAEIAGAARRAATSTLDDLGTIAFAAEIASLNHETLQPRLFLS